MPPRKNASVLKGAAAPQMPPLYRAGEVIVKFKDGTLPTKIPKTALQIAKALTLIELFRLLAQLDKSYGLVSIQPLVRDGHEYLDPVFQALALLLLKGQLAAFGAKFQQAMADGRLRSFPSDGPVAPGLALETPAMTTARLKVVLGQLLFRFEANADLDAIIKAFQKLGLIVAYAEKVPLRFIQVPVATATREGEFVHTAPVFAQARTGKEQLGDKDPQGGERPKRDRYTEAWSRDALNWSAASFAVAPGATPYVAILDTGVDLGHPQLLERVVTGFSDWVRDFEGHGTHIAGILVAKEVTDGAPRGLLPWPFQVISFKVVENEKWQGQYYPVDPVLYISAVEAIVSASADGVDMRAVNISLGSVAPMSKTESYWLGKLANVCPIAASAGNYVEDTMYPAADASCVAVGAAVDRVGTSLLVDVWEHSATAGVNGCVAPGVNILSTMPVQTTDKSNHSVTSKAWMKGTSMASPHVAALLASNTTYTYLGLSNKKAGNGLPRL